MEEALCADLRQRHRRASRRAWLAGALGLLAGAAVGLPIGRRFAEPQRAPRRDPRALPQAELEIAHSLCRGPLARLVDGYTDVLDAVELTGGDAELWSGIERLTEHCVSSRDPRAPRIAAELARTLVHVGAPEALRARVDDLRRVARGR